MNRIMPLASHIASGRGCVEIIELPRIGKIKSLMIDTPGSNGRVMIGDGANCLFDLPLRLMKAHWPPLDMEMEHFTCPQMRITGLPEGIEYTVFVVYKVDEIG